MNAEGRVNGLKQLYIAVGLRMSMPNWKWDHRTFNDMVGTHTFSDVDGHINTIVTGLEQRAFQSGDYTKFIERFVDQITPRYEDVAKARGWHK